jgi:copper homeostasis protein
MQLEVCVDSLEAALAAGQLGATRVELCAALEVGGLTPSAGLIEQTCQRCGIPVHVMIRPRGGSFVASDGERAIMLRDIEAAGALGAAAIVVGLLHPDGSIDRPGTAALAQAARRQNLAVTFHRAFDVCAQPLAALDALIELGVDHLLTSGQAATAWDGRGLLRQLVQAAAGRIGIIAAAGIDADHAADVAACGVDALHFTARRRSLHRADPRFGDDWVFDADKLTAIRHACASAWRVVT